MGQANTVYSIKAIHIAEKLKLKDLRERFSQSPVEFSNYEMVIQYSEFSYLLVYNFGSLVFFNVDETVMNREIASMQEFRSPSGERTADVFYVEVSDQTLNAGEGNSGNKVLFDRVIVNQLTYPKIRIFSMLIAESTALEYYEILVEGLLERANAFSRNLKKLGKILESSEELIKFIGMCLSTKQEIISNLYIVDSPEETWESVELDRIFRDLKVMLEVDIRYRALEYKIKIIQESIEILVDLSKTKRATLLELIIILLIALEILLSFFKLR